MEDIRLWIAALIPHWLALMSCAAFTFLGFWSTFRAKSRKWQTWATFSVAAIFLLVASFFAWQDEHVKEQTALSTVAELNKKLATPDFAGEIDWFGCGPPGLAYGIVTIWATITNPIGPPSIAISFRLSVKLPDGKTATGDFVHAVDKPVLYGITDKKDPLILTPLQNLVISSSSRAIPTGDGRMGWVMFRVPLPCRDMERAGTNLRLEFNDVQGHNHYFDFTSKGVLGHPLSYGDVYK